VADAAALDAIPQVSGGQQRRGWTEDGAELHRGERDLPELGDVAEHDEDSVSATNAPAAQKIGSAIRSFAHLRERVRPGGTVVGDNVQRGAMVGAGEDVEVVERPVEPVEHRPRELAGRGDRIVAVPQQQLPRSQERGLAHPTSAAGRATPPQVTSARTETLQLKPGRSMAAAQ
jgi:hypothetical protein